MAPHGARLLLLLVVAAAGLLEGRDAGVPVTLALYGELYDISSIGTWHPGGAQILRQAGNLQLPDATQLFESQHSMRDPDEMKAHLLPYRLNGTRAKQLYTFRPDGFYRTVKKRVANHIRPPGMEAPFRRAAPKGGFWLLGKFAFWMTCAAGLLVASVRAERLLVGGLLAFLLGFTLFMVCCFQVNHDASHLGASHSLDVAVFLDRLCEAILGWDRNAWQTHHVLLHHSYTGDSTLDPDMRHGINIWCKIGDQYRCMASPEVQFATSFAVMAWAQGYEYHRHMVDHQLRSVEWSPEQIRNKHPHALHYGLNDSLRGILFERWAWWQCAVGLWWVYWLLASYVAARGRGVSRGRAALRVLVQGWLMLFGGSFCYSVNVHIDHDTIHSMQNLGVMEADHSREGVWGDWGEVQVRGTANWGGPAWAFLFGSINYQIEHHLFPTLYSGYYPQIAPIVRQTCEEFGIPYQHYGSTASGLHAVFSQYYDAHASAQSSHAHNGRPAGELFGAPYPAATAYVCALLEWSLLACAVVGSCAALLAKRSFSSSSPRHVHPIAGHKIGGDDDCTTAMLTPLESTVAGLPVCVEGERVFASSSLPAALKPLKDGRACVVEGEHINLVKMERLALVGGHDPTV